MDIQIMDKFGQNFQQNLQALYLFLNLQRYATTGLKLRFCTKNKFSYFLTKTYVVGTQKNRLNEMVLLSTQNLC